MQRVTEIVLPRIFEWYKDDFGNTKQVNQNLRFHAFFAVFRHIYCNCSLTRLSFIPLSQEILAYYASYLQPVELRKRAMEVLDE